MVDEEVIVKTWEKLKREVHKWARLEKRSAEMAEDVIQETITYLLEASETRDIREPLNWCITAARHLWARVDRQEKKTMSLDNLAGSNAEGSLTSFDTPLSNDKMHNTFASLRQAASDRQEFTRDPADVTEQRDLIQKIDPDWREHIENGMDYTRGGKIAPETRDLILRRAKELGENRGSVIRRRVK